MIPVLPEFILILLAIAVFTAVIVSVVVIYSFRKTRYIPTDIDSIKPYFTRESPLKSSSLLCVFVFSLKGNIYRTTEILPISYFTGIDDAFIIYDVSIDLPVMYTSSEKMVGEEAIEHMLLSRRNTFTLKLVSGYLQPDFSKL